MERAKQIEEMAKMMRNNNCYNLSCQNCNSSRCYVDGKCHEYHCAKILVKQGYHKNNENEVVISKEEYERLKRVETEKDRLYEMKLDLENQLIEKGWTDYVGADEIEKQARKETAEKILKEFDALQENLSKKITQLKGPYNQYMNSKEKEGYEKAILSAKSIVTSFKSRLAKQFSVEI